MQTLIPMAKFLDLYKYFDGKVAAIESQICQQNVYNANQHCCIGLHPGSNRSAHEPD